MASGLNPRAMAALSSGHLATDFANGALPALLPFLVHRFELSYTLAAVVMSESCSAITSQSPAASTYPYDIQHDRPLPCSPTGRSAASSVW